MSKMRERAGGRWVATGSTDEEAKKKQPHQMQRAPQHACFPSLAHELRGDRSLISDAKSQELRAAGRYYACTCQYLRAAIKYPSRTWNAKCLQLGRAASTLALLWQTGLTMAGGTGVHVV